ncbi:MAG: class I SAM-dependent methyltransferase [Proteobacteria bacterium]|nr:class I SAM-dependent methyltransferase [Pseudomonadota bacterium]
MLPPRLYTDLAAWWPLFSPPDRYAEEADWLLDTATKMLGRRPATMLELGSGGGHAASHLGRHAAMTLVDASPAMLDVSRRLNPRATHVHGDMRTVRLGTAFDVVMIHDAVMYMTAEDDLCAALTTLRAHLSTNGIAVVLPDYVAETFKPHVESGGHDADDGSGRGLRYISWIQAPDSGATVHSADLAILLRDTDGTVRLVHDRHSLGLFTRATWRTAFARAGFAAPTITRDLWQRDVFLARPAG